MLKVIEERFPDVEEAHIQEVLAYHTAKLIEEGLQQLEAFSEPQDKEDSHTVVERRQLIIRVLKQGLQVVDVLVDHVLILDLQFKHNTQAAMAPYKECIRTYIRKRRRIYSNRISLLSSLRLLSPPPPCIPRSAVTPFCQNYKRLSGKQQHSSFRVY